MDKLPKHIMVLDTETIGLNKRYIYDIGFVIAVLKDGQYKEVESEHFAVKQVYDNKMLFETAYYAEKRPKYVKLLKSRQMKRKHLGQIYRRIKSKVKQYNIGHVFAYNSPFDEGALDFNTKQFKKDDPFKDVAWLDIQGIAYRFIHSSKQYQDFANYHNLTTEKGYLQTNAQSTYQAMINSLDFAEEHMGLHDSRLELAILNECIKLGYNKPIQHKRKLISSSSVKTHKIIKNGKTYGFNYHSMKNTKRGLVLN